MDSESKIIQSDNPEIPTSSGKKKIKIVKVIKKRVLKSNLSLSRSESFQNDTQGDITNIEEVSFFKNEDIMPSESDSFLQKQPGNEEKVNHHISIVEEIKLQEQEPVTSESEVKIDDESSKNVQVSIIEESKKNEQPARVEDKYRREKKEKKDLIEKLENKTIKNIENIEIKEKNDNLNEEIQNKESPSKTKKDEEKVLNTIIDEETNLREVTCKSPVKEVDTSRKPSENYTNPNINYKRDNQSKNNNKKSPGRTIIENVPEIKSTEASKETLKIVHVQSPTEIQPLEKEESNKNKVRLLNLLRLKWFAGLTGGLLFSYFIYRKFRS